MRMAEEAFFELDAPIAAGLRRRGADALRRAPRSGGAAAAGRHRRRRARPCPAVRAWRMSDFLMPALGADMEAGTLVEWLIKPGDRVKKGDVVAVVETQKGAIEVEIFDEASISELVVPVGAAGAGRRLCWHASIGEAEPDAHRRRSAAAVPAAPRWLPARSPPSAPVPPRCGCVRGPGSVPPARAAVPPSSASTPPACAAPGVDGAVTLADVERGSRSGRARARRARAARRLRSGRDAPGHRRRDERAQARDPALLPEPHGRSRPRRWPGSSASTRAQPVPERLLPAVAAAQGDARWRLREVPQLNGFWLEAPSAPGDGIHVGWAISLRGGGLVAPAIRDADRESLRRADGARCATSCSAPATGGLRSSELDRPDRHRDQPRRPRRRERARHHLSAAGGDRRLRARSSSGPGWSTGRSCRGPW